VVQEALTNVSRHSGSKTARIELRRQTGKGKRLVILTIADDGRGIAKLLRRPRVSLQRPGAAGGVGLASMRERLHQIGGWLQVESEVGRTIVTAVVPEGDAGPHA
jgi:two-component system, NarL family, sensor kinase